jgi:undecaprenyl-diphosphatase
MTWELKFMEWANGWWSSAVLDQVLPWLTYLGSHFAVIFFIILSWIITQQRKVLRRLVLLYSIQSGVLYGLKYVVQRQRPLLFLEMTSKLSKGPGEILDPSFPSGHAVFAFMLATLLVNRFPRYRVIFFIVAGFIGWTRIYLGLHYPTDVMAGALLGYGITKLFLKILSPRGFMRPSWIDEASSSGSLKQDSSQVFAEPQKLRGRQGGKHPRFRDEGRSLAGSRQTGFG